MCLCAGRVVVAPVTVDHPPILILIIVIMIAVIIVVSAVWCIIAFGVKRVSGYSTAYSERCYANAQEHYGETRVLGRAESDAPCAPRWTA